MTAEDHRSQARMLDAALHETADYANQLWNDLAAMRRYLHDALPAEPADGVAAGGASPVGPDDEQGWNSWCDAYAEVTSVLCGPRGDSGYGRSSAAVLAQLRRRTAASGPASQVYSARHVTQDSPRPPSEEKGVDASTLLEPLAYFALGLLAAALTSRNRLRRQR